MFFFFKQKTAYEMRISDWSSDVCSSDLFTIVEFAAGDTHIRTKGDFFGGSMTKTLANAHALFCGLKLEASYLARLDIVDNARANLMAARAKDRTVLKLAADNIRFEDRYWRDEIGRASCMERVCQTC